MASHESDILNILNGSHSSLNTNQPQVIIIRRACEVLASFYPVIYLTTKGKTAASLQRSKVKWKCPPPKKKQAKGYRGTLLPQLEVLIERKHSCEFQRNSIICRKDTLVFLYGLPRSKVIPN